MRLAEPTGRVLRGGRVQEISPDQIVPGDVILIAAGRRVPADARLAEAYGLAVDESALTGESVAAEKSADMVLPATTPLSERQNLVFAGTTAVRGRGAAVVVAIARDTELGRVAHLARESNSWRSWKKMVVPTLVIHGDEDRSCLGTGAFLKRTIPSAGLMVFPKTGHTINLEEPALFNFALQDFFTQVDSGRWMLRDKRTKFGSGAA